MNNTDRIIEIIKNEMESYIDPDMEITPEMNLASDLHVDSLDMVLIVDTIEEEFGIHIKTEDMIGITTIEDIDAKIKELQGAQ